MQQQDHAMAEFNHDAAVELLDGEVRAALESLAAYGHSRAAFARVDADAAVRRSGEQDRFATQMLIAERLAIDFSGGRNHRLDTRYKRRRPCGKLTNGHALADPIEPWMVKDCQPESARIAVGSG